MNWKWVAWNTGASAATGLVLTVLVGAVAGHIVWEDMAWGAWGYMLAAAAPAAPPTD